MARKSASFSEGPGTSDSCALERDVDLVLENCSEAQKAEDAMLACQQLQSTSDQQDPVRYAAIAASVRTGVAPEQSARWACPRGHRLIELAIST